MIGETLSHYRIIEKIGAGGMGEVYVAEDTKLSRKVALKVLPPEMAENAERRARFEREAKAVAALDHPNIVTIHSVEEAEGVHFYTMQLVKGKTLTELIPKKGMSLNKFFEIAIPLADAVSAAHEQGIIHRDLKPDNLMVSDEGRLKILDFGLAKLKPGFTEEGASELPTQSATAEGRILGTVAYMSPEQAEGKTVDHRSDIFSIGIILYEMATGERPFKGDTAASLLSSILKDTPKSTLEVNPALPRDLGKIIRRCLVKDTEHRYQTTKDLRNELEELKQEVDSGEVMERMVPVPRSTRLRLVAGATAILAALVMVFMLLRPDTAPVAGTFDRLTSQPGWERWPRISPDGKSLAYASNAEGNYDIYIRRVGGLNPINLTKDSTDDDTHPSFSPDGEQIAFHSERDGGGGLFLMGASGEFIKRVSSGGFYPSWSPDGSRIVAASDGSPPGSQRGLSQLEIIDVSTGKKRVLTAERNAIQPSWSPHGHRIAFYAGWDIWSVPVEGGEPVRVTRGVARDQDPAWSPDGGFLYYSSDQGGSSNIWRVPINERTGEIRGQPESVTSAASGRRESISISEDGLQILFSERSTRIDLYRFELDSSAARLTKPTLILPGRNALWPEVSPDGERLVFYEGWLQEQEDIGIIHNDGTGYRKLTDDPFPDRHPRWSPDGNSIAFRSRRSGKYEIWVIHPDGSGLTQLTRSQGDEERASYATWSPGGNFLAYQPGSVMSSIIIPIEEKATDRPLPILSNWTEEETHFIAWSWSSDGKRLAGWRRSKDTGEGKGIVIYLFETGHFESLTQFGRNPVWHPDGRDLLFLDLAGGSKLYLLNSETREVRELVSSQSGSFNAGSFSPDGRHIYTSTVLFDADIWMLTLNEERE